MTSVSERVLNNEKSGSRAEMPVGLFFWLYTAVYRCLYKGIPPGVPRGVRKVNFSLRDCEYFYTQNTDTSLICAVNNVYKYKCECIKSCINE